MADRGDTHYHVKHLNLWFTVSSLLLLVTAFWMVIDDWSRPWKEYQRGFREIEVRRARETLASDKLKAQAAAAAQGAKEIEGARVALAARQSEMSALEDAVREAKGKLFVSDQASKFVKAEYDWERYQVDEHRLQHNDPTYGEAGLQATYGRMQKAAADKENATLELARATARLDALKAGLTEAEKKLKNSTRDLELVQTRLEKIEPSATPNRIANVLRDFPGLDFIGPNLKVQKVVLENLTFELNFTKKRRIDMCMTCHMGIDRAGFESEAQPFAAHPRLDLYLTAKSAHPVKEVGCTICHRGGGEALDFVHADHRPVSEEQKEAWRSKHDWHKQHHWDYPMLPKGYTEASCVQCHKTSMELIASDAPRVSEGYRLFEEYACYACHKVDWFPTKRKPGPSLKNLQQKITPEFMASWVGNPKAFRPSTRMPQIFHLENFAAGETITKAQYGAGRDIEGQEWSDAAVAAITSYIFQLHPKQELPPVPVEGDAQRGRETFRVAGCLACHNLAPFGSEPAPVSGADLALERRGENEMGPDLRGVASKVDARWLYWWIKDPAQYWPDTRMPKLRLTDQEAADIAAYITSDPEGVFHDVPKGWAVAMPEAKLDVLQEQARWFFLRDGRQVLEERFAGKDPARRWDRKQDLLVAVGEKFVLQQGCYSCHEIKGLENTMPIGTELTNWATKTVDKLDFGFIPEIKADAQQFADPAEREHWIEDYKSYHNNFLEQKLHAPRSYDRKKIKNPTEKLRMPYFGFSDDQVKALTTFVLGLVNDEVQRAKMHPDEGQLARDAGMRAVRQNNCAACHVLEPARVTFTDEQGAAHTVAAEILKLEGETLPPRLDRWDEYLADYLAYMKKEDEEFECKEVSLRLLRCEPGLGEVGDTLTVPLAGLKVVPPVGGDFVRVVTDLYMKPLQTFGETEVCLSADPEGAIADVDGKARNYQEEQYDKVRWAFAPPVLLGEGKKLQREWFYSFLVDPVPLRHQLRVRMPSFQYDDGEAGSIADYFAYRAQLDWPADYARQLRHTLALSPDELARQAGLNASAVLGIEDGVHAEIAASFPKLKAFGDLKGFNGIAPAVDPTYERIARRAPTHVEPLLAADSQRFEKAENLARQGPNCFQCHYYKGTAPSNGAALPIAWAPDLYRVRLRLREDWVQHWIENPARTYPGTAMPINFPPDQKQHQQFWAGTSAEQIDAVIDWLYNMDRIGLNASL